ncbi:MAG: hypothetical protein KY456_03945 [Chloroflexi bacterium]|nr:hypothetical protein [Chloroflexota bacterium]
MRVEVYQPGWAAFDAFGVKDVVFGWRCVMIQGTFPTARNDPRSWRTAAAGLILAATIVGVAIVVGGATARILNPIGALLWLASGVLLALSLPTVERRALGFGVAIASGVILGALVRPGSLVEAVVGFAIAGAVVVLAAGDRSGGWALLAPAIYLPVHLLIGVGRAIVRGGGVRTDPPPTAAIVPLAMLLAAAVAGALVASAMRRNR